MSKNFVSTQRSFESDPSSRLFESKQDLDDLIIQEPYRNPVRMFAVAMNMRRLAHSRRTSLMESAQNR